jgi:hypothetical protein
MSSYGKALLFVGLLGASVLFAGRALADPCAADITPPVVTCPGVPPLRLVCGEPTDPASTGFAQITDNCDPNPTLEYVDTDVPNAPGFPLVMTILRDWIGTDASGNIDNCIQAILIYDYTPPVFSYCPDDITIGLGESTDPSNTGQATAADDCHPDPALWYEDVVIAGDCPHEIIINRTWHANDHTGEPDVTCLQVITTVDNTPPQLTCPPDVTIDCNSLVGPTYTGFPIATDDFSAVQDIDITYGDQVTGCRITRTWAAIDECDNQTFCVQVILLDDHTPPLVTCPEDAVVECFDDVPPPDIGLVTATDYCDPTPVIEWVSDDPVGTCPTVITRIYKATDVCDNVVFCSQRITVHDLTPPQLFGCPVSDITAECGQVPAPVVVTATDNCDGDLVVVFDEVTTPGDCAHRFTISRIWSATDACGNEAACSQTITVDDQEPPVFSVCPGDVTVECGNIPEIPVMTATDNCEGDVTVDLSEDVIPGSCVNTYTLVRTWTATDVCGNTATCQQNINVEDIVAPLLTCPGDFAIECTLDVPAADIALVTASDNCDQAPVVIHVGDDYSTETCPSIVTRTYRATDACGNEAFCTQIITIDDQSTPEFTVFPEDQTITLCEPAEICLGLEAEDNCGGSVLLSVIDGPGEESGNNWCYTPTSSESFDVTIRAEDNCGNSIEDVFHVDLTINTVPQFVNCPEQVTVHWGETLELDFTVVDPDIDEILTFSLCDDAPQGMGIDQSTGHLTWVTRQLNICDPTICVVVSDDCGATDICEIEACVYNEPPVITPPKDATVCTGFPFSAQATASDPDGGPYGFFRLVRGPAGLTVDAETGTIDWLMPVSGSWDVCIEAYDGAAICDPCSPASADTGCFVIDVMSVDIVIEKIHGQIQGQYTEVDVSFLHSENNWPIGGYDFLIQYDASALNFILATEGQFFSDCQWEYFTYRFGAGGNCAGGCPTGVLRVIAVAESTGGNTAEHPTCFTTSDTATPGSGSPTSSQLARLKFLVSDDRTLECSYVPIRFIWFDCGDNGLSSLNGDTLYVSNQVFDYAGEEGDPPVLLWNEITGQDNSFPTITGTPSFACEGSDKNVLERCANFYNGGIDIICADSIDAVGDLNLNGIGFEIADAVMLTNYFIEGLAAFEGHEEGSIAASDANRDGLALSVADLVFLIRVVIGDAMPYAKVSLFEESVSYTLDNGIIAISDDIDISGAALVVRGDVEPDLLADDMNLKYAFDGVNTRIVVTPPVETGKMASFRGEFLGGIDRELISLELATPRGAAVATKNVPRQFSLRQNYPNPFNPTTTIAFDLAQAGKFQLTIFNVKGQRVGQHSGTAEMAGRHTFEWNAANLASGVYLYRLEAGPFVQARKMLLLK